VAGHLAEVIEEPETLEQRLERVEAELARLKTAIAGAAGALISAVEDG
jgi:hypothetical protein